MACVHVCKTGAIDHEQQETFAELNIGAILYCDEDVSPVLASTLSLAEQEEGENKAKVSIPCDQTVHYLGRQSRLR